MSEIIQQQQNFEQLCERIKYLDIQQQTKVNNIINNNPKLYSTQLPSINEMIDNQSLIIRMGELEERINLQNQEIENLRKEFSELNEKLTLLVQLEREVISFDVISKRRGYHN
ncbi:8419_t:CDS:2 [Rhizophagus irregularis]|nr:8419_t:CDS:2 [Rhizophagus irregularis]